MCCAVCPPPSCVMRYVPVCCGGLEFEHDLVGALKHVQTLAHAASEKGRVDGVKVGLGELRTVIQVVDTFPSVALAEIVTRFASAHDLDPSLFCPLFPGVDIDKRIILRTQHTHRQSRIDVCIDTKTQ